jgi:hypothetical protein
MDNTVMQWFRDKPYHQEIAIKRKTALPAQQSQDHGSRKWYIAQFRSTIPDEREIIFLGGY